MIFLEFKPKKKKLPKVHFVGANKKAIMDDTNGGTEFAGVTFASFRKITGKEANALGLEDFENGVLCIAKQTSESYCI